MIFWFQQVQQFLRVGIIMTAWFVNGHLNQDQEMWKLTVFAQAIGTSVQMSVMIGLTFRAAKNRKTAPQIPRGPMYHEDDKYFMM